MDEQTLIDTLRKIPGGYEYSGICSFQVCFPLKKGGELRFGWYDDTDGLQVDLYGGELPPGITGPATLTGTQ